MSACVAVLSARVWSLGFEEMIVIALVLAFKNAFLMGMHFTGKSSVVCEANITAEGYRSSACVHAFARRRLISGNRLSSTGRFRNNRSSV